MWTTLERTRRRRALHLLAIVALVLPQPIAPATITVDGTTGDVAADGVCTLPEAIDNANDDAATHGDCAAGSGADDVVLTTDVTLTEPNNGSPGVGNGLPVVSSVVTILGSGYAVHRDAASDPFRILSLIYPANLTLEDVVVSGGRVVNPAGDSVGGGILNDGATLTLTNSTLTGNQAVGAGRPRAYGGGLYNLGVTTIEDSTISANVATTNGILGGASRARGGGIANCAVPCPGNAAPQLVIVASTVSGNSVSAIAPLEPMEFAYAYGGGIYNGLGSASITNSTISGNDAFADDGGAFYPLATGGGISTADADLFLVSTTIAANSVSSPGGAALDYFGFSPPTIEISETILGSQSSGYNCFGIDGFATDLGNNLDDDTTCGAGFAALTGLETTLEDNGGPTRTHKLLAGSSAIDVTGPCSVTVDQRGVARDGMCDSGAFEFVPCTGPEDVVVMDGQTLTEEIFEACVSITVNDRDVIGPDGHLILRTPGTVIIGEGFECDATGRVTVENDATILLPRGEPRP